MVTHKDTYSRSARLVVCVMMLWSTFPGRAPEPAAAATPTLNSPASPSTPTATGSWTQTDWTTPNTTLAVAGSGTSQYYRPLTAGFGVLTGTFGVCAGGGAWCQGSGDTAPGQTVRLAGNWRSDAGNFYSSDLNGDAISELIFANRNGDSWLYWGRGSSASPTWNTTDRADLSNAFGATVADLNGDGYPEVVLATFQAIRVYWGLSATAPYSIAYSSSAMTELPADSLVPSVSVADLNRDGRPELIGGRFAPSTSSVIYWGQAGNPYGVTYSTTAQTELSTLGAVGVSTADLNKDGWAELIFSNWIDGRNNINSYIYWGQAGGAFGAQYSASDRLEIPTFGARSTAIGDLNNDTLPDIIFANWIVTGNQPSYVYWGQAGGPRGIQYTVTASITLPSHNAHKVTIADFNNDGVRDVATLSYDYGLARIFWGPLNPAISFTLSTEPLFHGMSASDLNADGRLDLLVGQRGTAGDYWLGGTLGGVYFHTGNNSAPFSSRVNTPVQAATGAYASFGPGRGTNGDWASQPRPVYGTASPMFGVLESMLMDSGQSGTVWQSAQANTQIAAGTGITLFVAAADSSSALNNPTWVQVGTIISGTWTQTLSGVTGRYARYRVVLWRTSATEASPALQSITFNYITQAGAFSKTSPANSATGQPANPTLAWGASSGVNHYRYCFATSMGCAPVTSNGAATSVTLSGLTPGATYFWQARACADPTCAVFTDANSGTYWSFTVAAAPGAFNKTSPANAATDQPINPTLAWGASSGVNHYRYCYATSSGCAPATSVGANTSVALSGLTPGATYYWQARACADAGCTVFTDANSGTHWSFTTLNPPGAFNKTSPSNGATGQPTNPTLAWGTASNATTYAYCLNTSPSCATWTDVGNTTSTAVSGLAPGTTYFWQARACNATGCTDANSGSFWSFQTAAAVSSFNKLAPSNSAVNVNTATAQLLWSTAAGATDYKLCLGTALNTCDILGGGPGQYASVGNTYFRVLSDLPLLPNAIYYWQALATNGTYTTFANGGPLAFWSFTTLPNGPDAFAKLSPPFNATNVPTQNLTLQWQAATGAVSYTLCVGAFAGDCSFSITRTGTSALLPGPLPSGATLVWQVTAHNPAGSTSADNNTWWPFTTLPNAPQSFSKLNPPNGATGQTIGIALTWQDTPDEDYYAVCVGPSIGLCSLVNTTTTHNLTTYALTGLDYGATYWWQISACNAGGCTPANNGNAWSFSTLNPPAPGPFHKQHPGNAATSAPIDPAQILLQWSAAADADGYELCFGTLPATCDLSGGGFQNVGNTTSRLVSQLPVSVTLQPASTYWWQVRAYNTVTATRTFADGGLDFFFTTANTTGPAAFSKDAPVNNTFNLPTATLFLRWFPAPGAQTYELCAGSAPNLCDALPGNAWLNIGATTAYTLTSLQPGATYWWQVRALNSAGQTQANAGVWWTFHTQNQQPPADFSKAAPPHSAIGVPTATAVLSWFVSTGATSYEVCLGSAPALCETSGGWVNVGNATTWLPDLQAGVTYWWQARALGSGFSVQANTGQWWAFTTANDTTSGPADFQKTVPLSGTVVGGSLVLSWTASSGATGYRVCVGTAWGLCDIVNNATPTGLSHPLTDLPAGQYWWQITAVDAAGNTAQADNGARWRFTVGSSGIADLDNAGTRKDAAPTTVRMGERVTYTITLNNAGPLPVTTHVTDTLALSATLLSATPGYTQAGQTLTWSALVVPANNTATLTITVRAESGPLPDGYTLTNRATIAMHDGAITRDAPEISVTPWRAFAPIVIREP